MSNILVAMHGDCPEAGLLVPESCGCVTCSGCLTIALCRECARDLSDEA
jgi:hypothetical protein